MSETVRRGVVGFIGFIALAAGVLLPSSAVAASKAKAPLPLIFVHGTSGSAQQFETNAMRFVSNGFPQNRIFTLEYSTSLPTNDHAIVALDDLVDRVLARTGASKVNLLGHSRGTLVSQ